MALKVWCSAPWLLGLALEALAVWAVVRVPPRGPAQFLAFLGAMFVGAMLGVAISSMLRDMSAPRPRRPTPAA